MVDSVAIQAPLSTVLKSSYMHCGQFVIIIIRDASLYWNAQGLSSVGQLGPPSRRPARILGDVRCF